MPNGEIMNGDNGSMRTKAFIAAGALTAAALGAGGVMVLRGGEEAPSAANEPTMNAEDCAPYQDALTPIYLADAVVNGSRETASSAEAGSSEQLRAQADLQDAEKVRSDLGVAFMQPYDVRVQTAQDKVSQSADGSSDRLRAEADLKDAQEAKAEAQDALEGCSPASEMPEETLVVAPAALVVEDKWHIAGQGSCSPYTAANVEQAKRGELGTDKDLSDVEVEFLKQNPDFARNMAITSEAYGSGYIYDALGVALPSTNPETANESVVAVFENEYYVTAPLAEDTTVQNSYCDEQGNVRVYQQAILEADTYVGGAIVESETVADNGVRSVTLKNGRTIDLPAQALVANVKMADGSVVRMLASNKAGVSTDGDFEAEFGCENWIIVIPPSEQPPEVTVPTVPGQPTVPHNTTTTGVPQKHDDGKIPGPGGNSNTTQPAPAGNPGGSPTTSTTQAPATSSTTTATAPTTVPQNTTITAPAG